MENHEPQDGENKKPEKPKYRPDIGDDFVATFVIPGLMATGGIMVGNCLLDPSINFPRYYPTDALLNTNADTSSGNYANVIRLDLQRRAEAAHKRPLNDDEIGRFERFENRLHEALVLLEANQRLGDETWAALGLPAGWTTSERAVPASEDDLQKLALAISRGDGIDIMDAAKRRQQQRGHGDGPGR